MAVAEALKQFGRTFSDADLACVQTTRRFGTFIWLKSGQ